MMKLSIQKLRSLPTWGKILLSFLFLIVLILVAGSIFLDGMIDHRLRKALGNSKNQLYNIEYGRLRTSLLSGNMTMYDLNVNADSARYLALRKKGKAPTYLVTGNVKVVKIKHFNWIKYLFSASVSASQLIIESPNIALTQYSRPDTLEQDRSTLGSILSERLKGLKLGSFEITNAAVRYKYQNEASDPLTLNKFVNFDFMVNDLRLKQDDTGKVKQIIFTDYTIALGRYEYRTPDSMYIIRMGPLKYRQDQQLATLDTVSIIPRLSEARYASLNHQKERNDLDIYGLRLENIDMLSLIERGILVIKKVSIQSGKWNIYLNRTPPLPPARQDPVPIQRLKKIGLPLLVHEIKVSDFQFYYKEFNPKTEDAGKISFNDIRGQILNLTNIPKLYDKNPTASVHLRSRLMNVGEFRTDFEFDQRDPSGKFSVKASMGKLDAKLLNPGFIALNKLKITSGTIESIHCTEHGNESGASGTVHILYNDLHVNVLGKDKNSNKFTKKGFVSLVANILVKNDNPSKGDPERVAQQVTVQRSPERSFFNLLWMILFKGIGQIVTG